jgi:hypothetical protein
MNIVAETMKFFVTMAAVVQAEKKERQKKQKQLNDALPFTSYEIVTPQITQNADNKNF